MLGGRAGESTLREAHRRTWAVLRRPRIAFAGVAGTVVLIALELALYIAQRAAGLHVSGFVLAFGFGATVASVPWALWTVGLTMGGGAYSTAGAVGEEQTGRVLESLGPAWVFFHNVPFVNGHGLWTWITDVDHLAVGPWGVLVVETKFTSTDLDVSETSRREQAKAIDQARDNAGRVRGLLQRDAPSVPITLLVVWWGPNVTRSGDVMNQAGDVLVVRGGDSNEWLHRLSGPVQPEELIQRALTRIARYIGEQVGDRTTLSSEL